MISRTNSHNGRQRFFFFFEPGHRLIDDLHSIGVVTDQRSIIGTPRQGATLPRLAGESKEMGHSCQRSWAFLCDNGRSNVIKDGEAT